jgi:hypothetical protein
VCAPRPLRPWVQAMYAKNANETVTTGQMVKSMHPHGKQWTLHSLGAICGLSGGMVTCLFGCVLTVLAWVSSGSQGRYEGTAGTVLLFLTIPLLVIGAHCLDLVDRDNDRTALKRTKSLLGGHHE